MSERDLVREQEVLSSQVRLDGKGEDPAVAALLSPEFETMSNTEALNVALALQQLVRGVNSLLDNDKIMGEEISKLKARMDAQDRDARLWEEDRKKFLEMANEKMDTTSTMCCKNDFISFKNKNVL